MNATETPLTDSAMQGMIDGSNLPASELVKATKRLCEVAQMSERRALLAESKLAVARLYIERMAMPNTTEWLLTAAMQEAQGVLAGLDQIGKEANE